MIIQFSIWRIQSARHNATSKEAFGTLFIEAWYHSFLVQIDANVSDLDSGLIFEQDPVQIIDALLPLYLNSTLLRSLQVCGPQLDKG